ILHSQFSILNSSFFILNSSSFQRGVIVMTSPVTTEEKDRKLFWRRIKILCFAGLVCIRLATCARHKPVEEIVTINAGRPMMTEPVPASLESQPLQGSPQFSAIELIGDYLAETTVYLQEEQRLEALTTLAKAEQVTRQMMDNTQTKGPVDVSLRTIIQEQEQTEREIRGGNIEAALLNLGHLSQSLNQLESSMLPDLQGGPPPAISVSHK
ncbi:MAG TPA: hypothetical protein PKE58_10240, partial [Acidobacteriota bacterium]|nr:hypothetical protein [Acidobacteriota bacterium]